MKTPMSKTKKRTIASFIGLVLVVIVYFILRTLIVSGAINNYYAGIINSICIYVVAAVSLNIVTGILGQLVLGHAGFMMIGAYTSALITRGLAQMMSEYDWWSLHYSLPLGLLAGGLLAAVLGFLIGIPALRLRGDYLAIITLGFGEILRVVANNLSIINGAKGMNDFPIFSTRKDPAALFTYAFFIAAFIAYFSYTFATSRHGRAVISIREDEIAADSSGVNTTAYKLLAFTLSAFFGGIAGALLGHNIGVLQPSGFSFNLSVEILMMVVLGGMGSITGSVLSAGVLTVLPELLRSFKDYRMLLYSVLLVLVMLFRPSGLLGRKELQVIAPFEKLLARFKKAASAGKGGEAE